METAGKFVRFHGERSRIYPVSDKDKLISELTLDEVLEILNLIEKSDFDFLQLEAGDLKLTVGKQGFRIGNTEVGHSPASAPPVASQAKPADDAKSARIEGESTTAAAKKPAVKEGTVPITAPMVGTFYTTPEPGAPPFVMLGDSVDENTTVGLIEVMKVFNAVSSKVKGVIAEICVQNGQFIEYGQTLFLVKPE
jgi:acetyl-CoA carboxylase biotin carboxyl carrier protein